MAEVSEKVKRDPYDIEYFRKIHLIQPTLISDEDLGVDFIATVRKLMKDPSNNLDRLPMLLRPSGSYNPTCPKKLEKLMDTEIKVTNYGLKRINKDAVSLVLSQSYSKINPNNYMTVKELIPQGFEAVVKSPEDVLNAEVSFWRSVDDCGKIGKENPGYLEYNEEDEDEEIEPVRKRGKKGVKPGKKVVKAGKKVAKEGKEGKKGETPVDESIIARYGSDIEGSLYDHRSQSFNMLRLRNILPDVLHRYMETVDGVTTPYIYIAEKNSLFVQHVEDKDAWSVNYNHKGNPKVWYILEVCDLRRVEKALLKDLATFIRGECEGCEVIMRHKAVLFHPDLAERHGFTVRKIVQDERDIVLIPPRVIHWGFSTGPSLGEAINFTLFESLPFGYHAKICSKREEELPNFSMEWFVIETEPEKYKDYVEGRMIVKEPVTGEDTAVPPPLVWKTLKGENPGLIAGGIYDIIVMKHQDGEDLVYVNSPAGFTWVSRELAETLEWVKKGGGTPVKLYDELFSMNPTILKSMPQINRLLQDDNEDELFEIFVKAGLRTMPEILGQDDNFGDGAQEMDVTVEGCGLGALGGGDTLVFSQEMVIGFLEIEEERIVPQVVEIGGGGDKVVEPQVVEIGGGGDKVVEPQVVEIGGGGDEVVEPQVVEIGGGGDKVVEPQDVEIGGGGDELVEPQDVEIGGGGDEVQSGRSKRRKKKRISGEGERKKKVWVGAGKFCPVCNLSAEGFEYKNNWYRHVLSCKGTNKKECPICGKIVRSDYLREHNRRKHDRDPASDEKKQ